jgi:hypothetical protein
MCSKVGEQKCVVRKGLCAGVTRGLDLVTVVVGAGSGQLD